MPTPRSALTIAGKIAPTPYSPLSRSIIQLFGAPERDGGAKPLG